jgi:hypothetical protein
MTKLVHHATGRVPAFIVLAVALFFAASRTENGSHSIERYAEVAVTMQDSVVISPSGEFRTVITHDRPVAASPRSRGI